MFHLSMKRIVIDLIQEFQILLRRDTLYAQQIHSRRIKQTYHTELCQQLNMTLSRMPQGHVQELTSEVCIV